VCDRRDPGAGTLTGPGRRVVFAKGNRFGRGYTDRAVCGCDCGWFPDGTWQKILGECLWV